MVRLFALPPETTYRYYDGHDELADYGGDPANVDPLAMLWEGLRTHGELSAMMEGTLARLGEAPLRLHPQVTVARFGLGAEVNKLLEEIAAKPISLAELCAASVPGLARRLVYALAITRQLEAGTGLLPLGAEVAAGLARGAPPTAVARMALRSTVHRVGAAAPDAPGDGERGAPTVFSSRRSRDRMAGDGTTEEPASGRTSAPPVSDVAPVSQPASGPESGVVTVEEAPRAEGPPSAPQDGASVEGTPPLVDRSTEVESTTLQSGLGVPIQTLRASAPDLVVEEEAAAEIEDEHGHEQAVEVAEAASDAFAGMSATELFWLATEAMTERDVAAALDACDAGRKLAPDDPDLAALEVWARAQLGGADLKALAVQLDEVLGAHEKHVEARYYRGMLRKRLGDEAGCLCDLRNVVELSPEHQGACQELASIEGRHKAKERPSLFGKLFKR
jgi:hypothetical protein